MINPGYSYVMLFAAMTLVLLVRPRGLLGTRGPRLSASLDAQATSPFLVEALTALGLIVAPFVLPLLGFAPNTVNRILVWGLFGIGFDILFGYTGLLSFGQSAFFGTGGFVAAYLLTSDWIPERAAGAADRHGRRHGRRRAGRADRAAPHRHLFRHDHGGDRARCSSSSRIRRSRPGPAARTACPACRRRTSTLGFSTIDFGTGWSMYGSSRSATSSASCWRCASCARRSARS